MGERSKVVVRERESVRGGERVVVDVAVVLSCLVKEMKEGTGEKVREGERDEDDDKKDDVKCRTKKERQR